jgi:hypothetical protein
MTLDLTRKETKEHTEEEIRGFADEQIEANRPIPNSYVQCWDANGLANNGGRRFSNNTVVGTAITYATPASNGDTFTINEDGIYGISYTDEGQDRVMAIAKNRTGQPSFSSWDDDLLSGGHSREGGNGSAGTSVTAFLEAGDVIRAHCNNNMISGSTQSRFYIIQIMKL